MKNGPYELVIAPDDYPGFRYRGRYIYEHHLVWWQVTGGLVPEGFVVHHKNEKKRDNRFDNLELKSVSAHTKDHARPKAMVSVVCFRCGVAFEAQLRSIKARKKRGQKRFFCCRSHQVRQQHEDRRAVSNLVDAPVR